MTAVIVIVLVVAALWWLGVRRRPWKKCRACGGRGKLPGWIVGTHADCGRCQTTGRVRRVGAPRGGN